MTRSEKTDVLAQLLAAAKKIDRDIAEAKPPKEVKLTFAMEIAKALERILAASESERR